MTDTVEYTSANLTDAQAEWCKRVEAQADQTQCRIDRFEPDGSVYVHVHSHGQDVSVIQLGEDGQPRGQAQV